MEADLLPNPDLDCNLDASLQSSGESDPYSIDASLQSSGESDPYSIETYQVRVL
jgi:hypothetical protein